ncbi:MAG: class I SAM-dependent methyltransferase [Pricia sp.]
MKIGKKIRKHFSITTTRFNQQNELRKIKEYRNSSLDQVAAAITSVKNKNFTKEDRQAFQNCENYRNELLQDETLISYEIFGSDQTAKVKDICKNAASSQEWCQFLYFLAKKTKASNILEIGTNLGISGSYTLESIRDYPNAKLTTMEGLPQLCKISGKQFASLVPSDKYDIIEGLFDTTFPKLLTDAIQFDLLFIDGNHQKEPTLHYFEALKNKINSPAIFVFDDINWSSDMQEAWEIIKNDSGVNFTIDLYKQGVVIIDQQDSNQNVQFSLHLAY